MNEPTWILAAIGAISTMVLALIRRDTSNTRNLLAEQRVEIVALKTEIIQLRERLAAALDENLRLMRKLVENGRKKEK